MEKQRTFIWGKGGEKMTPEQVERNRIVAEALMAKASDTSPVGHWTAAATRALQGWLAGRDSFRADRAEEEGLASADAAIAALTGSYGNGGFTASSSGGGGVPSGTWTPEKKMGPVEEALIGADVAKAGGLSFGPDMAAADPGVIGGGQEKRGFGSRVMTPQEMLIEGATRRGLNPIDVATAISYETGGRFDPMIAGPTTQWGRHRGLIQFGEPQARQHGVDFSSPDAAWQSQLNPENGAVWSYLERAGVKPGMGLPEVYSAINAGSVGRMNASDANNGGAPGTVADKVASMGPHREKAAAFLGGTWTPNPNAGGVTMSTSGPTFAGGAGGGGVDIGSLIALQANPWVSKKYGGVISALMDQQLAREKAIFAQQLAQSDPMYQAQLAQLTAPPPEPVSPTAEREAFALAGGLQPGTPEYAHYILTGELPKEGAGPVFEGGQWWDVSGGQPVPLTEKAVDPTADIQNYMFYVEQARARGESPVPFEVWDAERKKAGAPNTNVEVNGGAKSSVWGEPPKDMVWLTDGQGNVVTEPDPSGRGMRPIAVPIGGGPQDNSAKEAIAREESAQKADIVLGKIGEIETLLGQASVLNPVTGFGAETLAEIGGTNAANAKALIDTIAANVAFDALAAMRAASPTGGALGSITERELDLLSSTISSLKQTQDPEQFARQLQDLKVLYQGIMEKAAAYPNAAQFGFTGAGLAVGGDQSAPAPQAARRKTFNPATGAFE